VVFVDPLQTALADGVIRAWQMYSTAVSLCHAAYVCVINLPKVVTWAERPDAVSLYHAVYLQVRVDKFPRPPPPAEPRALHHYSVARRVSVRRTKYAYHTGCGKKNPFFGNIFPTTENFLNKILAAYIVFISMQNNKILFNYL